MRAKILSSSLLSDIARLLFSGAIAQIIALLLLYFIGRQYSQEDIGIQGFFLSWGGILTTIAMGRYEQAIVTTPYDRVAKAMWHVCMRLALLTSTILCVCSLLVSLLWTANPIGSLIHLLPPYVLLCSWIQATMMLLLRHRSYTTLAIGQGLRTISNNVLKVAMGAIRPMAFALIISAFVSSLLSAIPLAKSLLRLSLDPWHKRYYVYLRRYSSFPLYSMPQALLNTSIGSLLIIFIPLGYSMYEVGVVSMIMMLVRRPILVLSDSIGQVYFERMSRIISSRYEVYGFVKRLIIVTLAISLLGSLIIYLFIDHAIRVFLGEQWGAIPNIILYMLPYLSINFLNSILNVLPDILSYQRLDLIAKIVRITIESALILLGISLYSFSDFISYYYGAVFFLELGYLILLLYLVVRYEYSRI